MVASTACPDPDQLRRFFLGLVSPAQGSLVEQHVAGCPACLAHLEMLSAAERLGGAEAGIPEARTVRAERPKEPPASHSAAETPPRDTEQAPAGSADWPRQIGRYQVQQLLGWGGMGTVYLARDPDLDRLVAIKVPHFSGPPAAQAEARQRFLREARAAARLQHAHIVQIYEVNERDDYPFLAMEYVGGGSLAEKLARAPLQARAAAELVEVLARATHFAHQHGVVHRDLKPANILLAVAAGPRPGIGKEPTLGPSSLATSHWPASVTPKITDFGLAKLLEEGGGTAAPGDPTRTGAILGTPSYMAPEQADSKGKVIGPAVDVYALGAILYEALTGRPPFLAESALETLAQVRSAEPVPPGRLQPKVPRDLETICLKCLHKEPSRRYTSALELAEDLRRFQAGETIRARPARTAERLWRWCRRRPAVASLLAILTVVVLGSLLVMTGLWLRAEANLTESNDNFDLARRAVDELYIKATEDPLLQEPGMEQVRQRLLEPALKYYLAFLEKRRDDPRFQKELAVIYSRVAQIHRLIGNKKDALDANRAAHALLEKLVKLNPSDAPLEFHLAQTWRRIGVLQYETGEYDTAERSLGEAITILNRLTQRDRPSSDWQWQLANTCDDLGNVFRSQREHDRALEFYERSVALRKGLVVAEVRQALFQNDLAGTHSNIAVIYFDKGENAKGWQACQEALAIQERLVREYPNVAAHKASLALNLNNFGDSLPPRDPGWSKDALERARTLLEDVVQANRRVTRYQYLLAVVCYNLGKRRHDNHDPGAALQSYERARDLLEDLVKVDRTVPDWQQLLAMTHSAIAELLSLQKPAEALKSANRARAISEELVQSTGKGPGPQGLSTLTHSPVGTIRVNNPVGPLGVLAVSHNRLGIIHMNSGKFPEALAFFKESRAVLEKLKNASPNDRKVQEWLGDSYNNIAFIHQETKNYSAALPLHKEALVIRTQLVKDYPNLRKYQFELANTYLGLGIVHRGLNEHDAALRWYQQADEILKELVQKAPTNRSYQDSLARLANNLGVLHLRAKNFDVALGHFQQACSVRQKLAEIEERDLNNQSLLARCWNGVAETLEELKRYEEAAAGYRQAVVRQRIAFDKAPAMHTYRYYLNLHYKNVARCERLLGRPAEAAAASLERGRLYPDDPKLLYAVAGDLALCVPLVGKDKTELTKEEQAERARFADQAMATLRQAVTAKFDDIEHLQKEPSLAPLRTREDFQRLLAEIEERNKKRSQPAKSGGP